MAAGLTLTESRLGTATVVSASGRLDAASAPALEALFRAVAGRGAGSVVLDCGGLAYISSAGIRALLIGAKTCLANGCEFAVAALSRECRAVLEASGLLSLLNYGETPEAALAAIARPRAAPGKAARALRVEESQEGAITVLELYGRLDAGGASVLLARISSAIERGPARVVLDCAAMDYVNSAGLRALLIGARACRQEGGAFALAALAPRCRSVVEMSGFLSVIDYHETREAAVAVIGREARQAGEPSG